MNTMKELSLAYKLLAVMVVLSATYITFASIYFVSVINDLKEQEVIFIKSSDHEGSTKKLELKSKPEIEEKEVEPKVVNIEVKEEPKKEPKKEPKIEQLSSEKIKTEAKPDDRSYLLAQIINAEAKGEPYNGKVAVGNVIMNRVDSDDFPNTIKEVIFQKGQFQPVSNGSIYNKPDSNALKAAKEVMDGKKVVGEKALYFYNPETSTSSWIFSRTTLTQIGNHRFAY